MDSFVVVRATFSLDEETLRSRGAGRAWIRQMDTRGACSPEQGAIRVGRDPGTYISGRIMNRLLERGIHTLRTLCFVCSV